MVVNKNGNIVGWDSWKETIESENEAKFAANNDFEHDYDLVKHLILANLITKYKIYKKINFKKLSEMFKSKIPIDCSAYIFETRNYKSFDAKLVPFLIKMNRFELILQCIIKSQIKAEMEQQRLAESHKKIYSLNRLVVGRKFRLLVVNERTMSSDIVNFILRQQTNPDYLYLTNMALKESDSFKVFYESITDSQVKESFSKNYLQAACFVNNIMQFMISQKINKT